MIPHALSGLTFVERFYSLPSTASTNDVARSLVHRPKSGIYCIQADRQPSGRGRRGGTYFSDHPGGLWVSLVVPVPDISQHFVYNRAISLAILLSLEQCGKSKPVTIKWPNDIYWGEKKVCGILLENHPVHENTLIIGFGINVNMEQADFPAELEQIATSVLMETGKKCALTALLRTILKQFMIIASAEIDKVHTAYSARLFGKGKRISINDITGIYTSVAVDGTLLLSIDGQVVQVSTGSPVFLPEENNSAAS